MAVEVETRGQLQEFLGLLSRRRWQVLLPFAVVLSLGVFIAVVVPKKFVVKTQIELRPVGVSVSAKDAANAPFQIKARERIRKVTQELQNREYLSLPPSEQQEWLEDTSSALKVTTVQSNLATSFVNIEYSHVNDGWAVDFLRALRNDWTSDVIQRDRNKIQEESLTLLGARDRLVAQYKFAESELTDLLREYGLSATQPVPGQTAARSEDTEFERLRAAEVDLRKTKDEIEESQVLLAEYQDRLAKLPPKINAEDRVVGGFSNAEEIAKIELQILEAQKKLEPIRPAHSQYDKLQDEVRRLEASRESLKRQTSKGELLQTTRNNPEVQVTQTRIDRLTTEIRVNEAKRDRLQKAVDEGSRHVEELQTVYRDVREKKDAIARLSANVATAEAAYQAKARDVQLLLSPLANPFEITQEVFPPSKPTEPNPLLIISFALVAGLAIGLGIAVVLEYSKNSFRSVGDIGRVMAVPVLGSIQRIVTRRETRLVGVRRIAVGAASLTFIGAVLFVTWAWANDATYLSQDVRDAIEGLRARMK